MTRRVFFGLSGGLGPVIRCMPIADLYKRAGAEVSFSIYGENAIALIENAGYCHLRDDDPTMPDPLKLIESSPVFYDMDHYYAQMGLLDKRFAEAWIIHRINMLKQLQPDIVFADMSPQTVLAARYLGIPVIAITQACFHPQGQRVRHWSAAPRNLPKVTPVINKVLDLLDMPRIHQMEELLAGDLNIVPGIPEFDPIQSGQAYYVGPLEQKMQGELKEDAPDILLYPGRLQDSAGSSGLQLIETMIRALADQPYRVLLSTNEELPADVLASLPPNIQRIRFFSAELLARARLFIHHGGHGSCMSAIMHGVPSLVIPTHSEREYNARKVWELGVGEYLLPGCFTADHLNQMATFIMEDQYRDRAIELRETVMKRKYAGAAGVYQLAERHIAQQHRF